MINLARLIGMALFQVPMFWVLKMLGFDWLTSFVVIVCISVGIGVMIASERQ